MSKIRVYDLAKELNMRSKDLVRKLQELDIPAKNHMSSLTEQQVKFFKNSLNKVEDKKGTQEKFNDKPAKQKDRQKPKRNSSDDTNKNVSNDENQKKSRSKKDQNVDKKKKNDRNKKRVNKKQHVAPAKIDNSKKVKKTRSDYKKKKAEENKEVQETVILPSTITVGDLASKINISVAELITNLMKLGVMASINQEIDFETAAILAEELNIKVELEDVEDEIENLLKDYDIEDDENDLVSRPPVITVMGHVDHGKTSLLDALRNTNVTSKEAGGITQHIGAYTVKVNDQSITFIDTPGHEAFTAMRSRGAQVTDIAILVVAADDGVMPQTVEAINHAKAADVPIVVAINKIDKPTANPDRVLQELAEHNLIPEDWGGDTITVPVSAHTGEGLDTLLEMILLVAEMLELKANPNRLAKGTVIEAQLDKGKGAVATLLINTGTLHVGDVLVSGTTHGRVRAMINDKGKRVKSAGPSTPVEIIGLSEVPEAGEDFYVVNDEKVARQIAEKRKNYLKDQQAKKSAPLSLDDLYHQIQEGTVKDVNIVVKADGQGSVEAIKSSLMKLSNEEVRVNIIHDGVGAVSESDVMLAAASNAIIIGFNVRPGINVNKVAEREEVDIRLYRVIYDAIEDIEAAMKGMLEPEYKEVVTATLEVRQTFKVPNVGTIGGCYVLDGKIARNHQVRVIRDGIVITEGEIASLKRFKDDVREVAQGYECGLGIEKFNDIKVGDIIEAFTMEEIPR